MCSSVGVTLREFSAPVPGGLDYFFEGRMFRLPAEDAFEFFIAGDQRCGIAGTARGELVGDFAAGDLLGNFHNLEIGVTGGGGDVEGFTGDAIDVFQGEHVGIGYVENVDKVADAGAVGSRIVEAEDFHLRKNSQSGVEDPRNQVGFHAVVFATLFAGAGGVEIADGHAF